MFEPEKTERINFDLLKKDIHTPSKLLASSRVTVVLSNKWPLIRSKSLSWPYDHTRNVKTLTMKSTLPRHSYTPSPKPLLYMTFVYMTLPAIAQEPAGK